MAKKQFKAVEATPLLKLDFGCGRNPRQGFDGVDSRDFGQKYHVDLGKEKWPWPDNSVEEAHASHFIEHLNGEERVHFVNELYRVLIPGGKCTVITPHWASNRAYGDLTHQWPPVAEFWFYYLSKTWRENYAPHNDMYECDFDATWGYNLSPALNTRTGEYQQYAMQYYKEACQDLIATLVKK